MRHTEQELAIKYIQSPIGKLGIIANDNAVVQVLWPNEKSKIKVEQKDTPVLEQAANELEEYFSGKLKKFSVKTSPEGTEFQKSAWKALQKIPHGKTISYQQQAANIGDAKKARAVGMANGKNPIPVIIPCHRVIGKNGSLTGFGGGLKIKQKLLDLESAS